MKPRLSCFGKIYAKNLIVFSELEVEDTDLYKPQSAWAAFSWLGEAKASSKHVIDRRADRRNSVKPSYKKEELQEL